MCGQEGPPPPLFDGQEMLMLRWVVAGLNWAWEFVGGCTGCLPHQECRGTAGRGRKGCQTPNARSPQATVASRLSLLLILHTAFRYQQGVTCVPWRWERGPRGHGPGPGRILNLRRDKASGISSQEQCGLEVGSDAGDPRTGTTVLPLPGMSENQGHREASCRLVRLKGTRVTHGGTLWVGVRRGEREALKAQPWARGPGPLFKARVSLAFMSSTPLQWRTRSMTPPHKCHQSGTGRATGDRTGSV